MNKYNIVFINQENLTFVCKVKETKTGIEFSDIKTAIKAFKEIFPDFIILPITKEDLKESLKNIELYYYIYFQFKELKDNLANKLKAILIQYSVIDTNDNLLIDLSQVNRNFRNRKKILIIEKNIKKEYEINNVFIRLNQLRCK